MSEVLRPSLEALRIELPVIGDLYQDGPQAVWIKIRQPRAAAGAFEDLAHGICIRPWLHSATKFAPVASCCRCGQLVIHRLSTESELRMESAFSLMAYERAQGALALRLGRSDKITHLQHLSLSISIPARRHQRANSTISEENLRTSGRRSSRGPRVQSERLMWNSSASLRRACRCKSYTPRYSVLCRIHGRSASS